MSQLYEIVIVYNPDLEGDALGAEVDKVAAVVRDCGGQIEKREIWGRRQLAYPIRDRDYGMYVVLVASADDTFASTLRRQLRLNEAVLRELVVLKDRYAPDLEIEKVEKRKPSSLSSSGSNLVVDEGDAEDDTESLSE
jgi:small subunit ribosomal protein S6